MKRILFSSLCVSLAFAASAQFSDKKVQAGLAYETGLNLNTITTTKIIERAGAGGHNALGLNLNFSLTPNIAFATGVEFDFESFKYDVIGTKAIQYRYSDNTIFQKDDAKDSSNSTLFLLEGRKQKTKYLSIPTMLMFRTNPIGDFRYFGKFGLRSGFVLTYAMNDEGFNLTKDKTTGEVIKTAATNEKMTTKDDMIFFRSSVGVAGGAEWNFTGSTTLFAELGFYYGITKVHTGNAITGDDKTRNMTLFNTIEDPNDAAKLTDDYITFGATQKQIVLKIGILF